MKTKGDAHNTLTLLKKEVGIFEKMVADGAKEQLLGDFRAKCRDMDVHLQGTEAYKPWTNYAETVVRELKRSAGRMMVKSKAPKNLWDHCMELAALQRSHTAMDIYGLQGQTPEAHLTGETPDISHFVDYEWYQWVKYIDNKSKYPDELEVYGKYLGPSNSMGNVYTSKILKPNGQTVYTSSFRSMNADEVINPDEIKERQSINQQLVARLGKPLSPQELQQLDPEAITPEYPLYQGDSDDPTFSPAEDMDDVTPEEFDYYVGASVTLNKGGTQKTGFVRKRARNNSGELIGKSNPNPILDTRNYEVEFFDGDVGEYTANVIAESMWAHCDAEGNQYLLLDSIVDHKITKNAEKAARKAAEEGLKYTKKATTGHNLCCQWKDGSTSWEPLSRLKESNPVQVAEYAVKNKLVHYPAYSWWVPHILRKRDRIIAKVKTRYQKRTHKFGIEIPKTVARALEIDEENGNTYWRDAIAKEMKNVRVAFDIFQDGDRKIPPGYQHMKCHMVFDVKMSIGKEGDHVRKAWLVAGGHTVNTPSVLTYASVVSRDTVRIALTLAALNGLEVKAGDVLNAYLTAPVQEKIYTTLGPEFGEDEGKTAIIKRALYGLKSSGQAFGEHIADCMRKLGYTPCLADPDLWMKPEIRPSDGHKYYAYILLYVDDVLVIHHDANAELERIDNHFEMKPGSMGDPDLYLGAKLRKVTIDGTDAWSFSSSKYVQASVQNVEEFLNKRFNGRKLAKKVGTPWKANYHSELDDTEELDPEMASYYQSQVGVLHWMVELGRVDIMTEVSTLASHMALPRKGHLEALFHVFAYLKIRHNCRMVFDPRYPDINFEQFPKADWKEFYGDVKEAIPSNAPSPRGECVILRLYVDSDHAGDRLTRRSRTGFFIFLNMAPVMWLSKKQATIETSVFGSESVAMKVGVETLRGLRYKLRMMGVTIDGPSYVFGDNMSVIKNTSNPHSTLNKKSNSICYHFIREAAAAGEIMTGHIPSQNNPADVATKLITNRSLRDHLLDQVVYFNG